MTVGGEIMAIRCSEIKLIPGFEKTRILAGAVSRNNEIRMLRMVPPEESERQSCSICRGDAVLLTAYLSEWNEERLREVFRYGVSQEAACIVVFDCGSGKQVPNDLLQYAERQSFPVILIHWPDQPIRVPVTRLYERVIGGSPLDELRDEFFSVMLSENPEPSPHSMIRRIENSFSLDFGVGCQAGALLCIPEKGTDMGEMRKKHIYEVCHREMERHNIHGIDSFRDQKYLMAFPAAEEEAIRHFAAGLMDRLKEQDDLQNVDFYGGIGNPQYGMNELRESFEEARLIIRAMEIFDEPGSVRMVPEYRHFMLLLSIRDDKKLFTLRNPKLRPLYMKERSGSGQELAQTLEVYLSTGRNAKLTAEKLFIHRNTLNLRLKKIENMCGIDLSDPKTAFELQFAVYVEKCLIYG